MGFDFEIKYKSGIENKAADALSRKLQFSALSTVQFVEWDDLEEEISRDEKLRKMVQDLMLDSNAHKGYTLHKSRLHFKGRLVIPKGSPKIPLILKEFHDSAVGGHSGYFRT